MPIFQYEGREIRFGNDLIEVPDANVFIGPATLGVPATGGGNVAMGTKALAALTTGITNVAIGYEAMVKATTAEKNVAVGTSALSSTVTGAEENVAVGQSAMQEATTPVRNVAIGQGAMLLLLKGKENVALGNAALQSNKEGKQNVAVGYEALKACTVSGNVAVGAEAGVEVSTGTGNVLMGTKAGATLTGGAANTMIGNEAGAEAGTTAANNIAIGQAALKKVNPAEAAAACIGIGVRAGVAVTTGERNLFIGSEAGVKVTTSGRNVCIGYKAGGAMTTSAENRGQNVFVGDSAGTAGITTQRRNTGIGTAAMDSGECSNAVGVGFEAGGNQQGEGQVALGYQVMGPSSEVTSSFSVVVVYLTMCKPTAGPNVGIGKEALNGGAGEGETSGKENTALGTEAGRECLAGSGNVFLGHRAGKKETGSNKLYIAQSETTEPLIKGDFVGKTLRVYGRPIAVEAELSKITSGYKAAVLADGPVSYWRMDSTTEAKDIADSNNGTLHGTIPVATGALEPGDTDKANEFTGEAANFFSVADNANLHFVEAASVEAWIKSPTLTGFVFERTVGGVESTSYGLGLAAKEVTIFFKTNVETGSILSATNLTTGWTHLVGTYDGTNIRLYINGEEVAKKALTGKIEAGAGESLIGKKVGSSPFNGLIDEIAVYKTVLTPQRIRAHYEAQVFAPEVHITNLAAEGTIKLPNEPVLPKEVAEGETIKVSANDNCHFNSWATIKGTVEVLGELSEAGINQTPPRAALPVEVFDPETFLVPENLVTMFPVLHTVRGTVEVKGWLSG